VLIVVAGAGSAFALTAGVGARRAWTAWDRLGAATLAPDGVFSVPPDADPAKLALIPHMPGVIAVGSFTYVPIAPAPLVPGQDAGGLIALNPQLGQTIYRGLLIEGRHADPRRADEVTVNELLAKRGIRVGQRVRLSYGFAPDTKQIGSATVVGIERTVADLGINNGNAAINLTYGFLQLHRDQLQKDQPQVGSATDGIVRLRGGEAGRVAFDRALKRTFGPIAFAPPADPFGDPVRQVIDVQRIAWALLAGAAGVALLVAASQAVMRVTRASGDAAPTLRSMGMSRRHMAAVGAVESLVAATAVAVIGVVVGIAASGLVPSGLAKRADPDPGIRVEPVVLVIGALLIVLVLVGAGVLGAWRAADPTRARQRAGARVPTRGPAPVALGTHWALASSPGPAASAARSALVAVAAGLAGVLAGVTFARSSDRLHAQPRLHGWDFDVGLVGSEQDPSTFPDKFPGLAADPNVTALAFGAIADIILEGEPTEIIALDQVKGAVVHPTLLDGRAPAGAGEIALGTGTLQHLDKHIGDVVTALSQSGPQRLRIVGRAAYPEMGNNGDVAHFGSLTTAGLGRLGFNPVSAVALFDVRDGVSAKKVAASHGAGDKTETEVHSPGFEPRRVHNLSTAGSVPWALAAFLTALAVAAVGHALVMSVRARRRDIAVLRTLGLVRRQVVWAVAAQATTTIVVGAIVGVPLGIAAGRWSWALVASGLGVVDSPVVPALLIAAIIAGGALLANLLASVPAAVASRLRPAAILRSE
jgi:hypothetical protein